jgi:hypothetical protein
MDTQYHILWPPWALGQPTFDQATSQMPKLLNRLMGPLNKIRHLRLIEVGPPLTWWPKVAAKAFLGPPTSRLMPPACPGHKIITAKRPNNMVHVVGMPKGGPHFTTIMQEVGPR